MHIEVLSKSSENSFQINTVISYHGLCTIRTVKQCATAIVCSRVQDFVHITRSYKSLSKSVATQESVEC